MAMIPKFLGFLIFLLLLPRRPLGDETSREFTLAMIKPDGLFGNYTGVIKNTILGSGFSIHKEMTLQLDEDMAKNFYAEHSSKSFFPNLVTYITSGPVVIMVLEKVNAVSDWRALIGPTDASKAKVTHPYSIRAICGVSLERNCVHGSDSPEAAAREISFFFKEKTPGVVLLDEHKDSPEAAAREISFFFKEKTPGGNVAEHDEL